MTLGNKIVTCTTKEPGELLALKRRIQIPFILEQFHILVGIRWQNKVSNDTR